MIRPASDQPVRGRGRIPADTVTARPYSSTISAKHGSGTTAPVTGASSLTPILASGSDVS
jgi:hypothetical protein